MYPVTQKAKDNHLLKAIENCDEAAIAKALKRGANPNATFGEHHFPALSVAVLYTEAEKKAQGVIQALVAGGANLNGVSSPRGNSALITAVNNHRYQVCVELIRAGIDVDIKNNDGWTALARAVNEREFRIADLIVTEGKPKNTDYLSGSVLAAAIEKGAAEWFIKNMVAHGIDANRQDQHGRSAAHYAAIKQMSHSLADVQGLKVNLPDHGKITPMFFAARDETPENLKRLIALGGDFFMRDDKGETPLIWAAKSPRQDNLAVAIAHLKRSGHPQDAFNEPLVAAAGAGQLRNAEMLLDAGANVNARDANNKTPLIRAVNADKTIRADLMALLVERGADISLQDRDGKSVFDYLGDDDADCKGLLSASISGSGPDGRNLRKVNKYTLEIEEGGGLSTIFNFWTRQVIIRQSGKDATMAVQNFSDMEGREAIVDAYLRLKALGGNPPEMSFERIDKGQSRPGLKAAL